MSSSSRFKLAWLNGLEPETPADSKSGNQRTPQAQTPSTFLPVTKASTSANRQYLPETSARRQIGATASSYGQGCIYVERSHDATLRKLRWTQVGVADITVISRISRTPHHRCVRCVGRSK